MNAIILDCEIVRAICKKGEERLADIQYCEGWTDYLGMGISVVVGYDYMEGRHRIFLKDNLAELFALMEQADVVIGFNSRRFDQPLLEAHGAPRVAEKTYDLLEAVWEAAGLDMQWNYKTHGGYSLDSLAKANGLAGKSGSGAMAPINWQRGQYGSVIDYAIQDVVTTKQLIDKILCGDRLNDPKYPGGELEVRTPWEMARAERKTRAELDAWERARK